MTILCKQNAWSSEYMAHREVHLNQSQMVYQKWIPRRSEPLAKPLRKRNTKGNTICKGMDYLSRFRKKKTIQIYGKLYVYLREMTKYKARNIGWVG